MELKTTLTRGTKPPRYDKPTFVALTPIYKGSGQADSSNPTSLARRPLGVSPTRVVLDQPVGAPAAPCLKGEELLGERLSASSLQAKKNCF